MGVVYRARDIRLEREVAVKVLPDAFAQDPNRRARFEREAKAVAALSHPNILAIHDYGTHETITYAVMELLEGETLRDRLKKGPLPWREATDIGIAVADGLAAAHAKGILHRDIKPENLFLTADGRVKILDFGLARMTPPPSPESQTRPYTPAGTDAGTVMGTVGYMSPEQVRGQPANASSDLFSLGCVLYEMLTGRRAFRGETAAETMTAILRDEPPDPMASVPPVPAEFVRIIGQCLAKTSSQRLQSARDLSLGLRAMVSDPTLQRPVVSLRFSPRLVRLAAALLLIAVGGLSVYLLTRGGNRWTVGKPAAEGKPIEAVAVLPFQNVGGDPKTEYLSDGLADHLINSLCQVGRQGLKVRPFTSVSRYKGKALDAATFGPELNVQMIVTGKLHQQGDDLTISVAMVDVRQDNQFWGNTYRGKREAILDLQGQIARDVTARLRLRLTAEEEQRLMRRYTEDPEAYLLYREAVYHFNKLTEPELEVAIDYCQRAIKNDPKYALAYARLGRCYLALGALHRGPRATFPEARKHLVKALEIDPAVPDAYSGLGLISLFLDWNWTAAERELKQGLDLDSSMPSWNSSYYGFYLAAMGQLPEALACTRLSEELDPLAAGPRAHLAQCYNWMGQYDQAIAEAQKALDFNPHDSIPYRHMGLAYTQKGMHEKALEVLHKGMDGTKGHAWIRGQLGYAYAKAGQTAQAREALEELKRISTQYGCAFAIARIYAALGEKDQAFTWLRKAGDERDPLVIWLKVDPMLDSLRSDPRFAQVVKDMGLPP
jgi:TolB-like protein/Tfp pilus assembly protein PilF